MKRIITALAMLAALVVPSSASADSSYRHCGNKGITGPIVKGPITGAGFFNIRVREVACRAAARLIRSHTSGRWDCDFAKREGTCYSPDYEWECRWRSTGYESAREVCLAHGGRRVRYLTAA